MLLSRVFRRRVSPAAVAICLLSPLPGRAQQTSPIPPLALTLRTAYELAARENPTLRAERDRVDVARGALRQASAWRTNPDVNLNGSTNPSLTLLQEIEWAGQRGQRRAAATADLTATVYARADATRLLMREVGVAFNRSMAAAARRRIAEEVVRLTSNLVDAVRIQLREGEISPLEANLGEIELGRARARVSTAHREQEDAEGTLRRLLGLPSDTKFDLLDEVPTPASVTVDELTELALRQRPDLRARDEEVRAATAELAVTRREAYPALRVGFYAERDAGVGPALGLSIPLLNRNRGAIEARTAEVRRREQLRRADQAAIRQDVATAVAMLASAKEAYDLFAADVLDPARTNARLLEESYRAGKIPLPTLLLLRNQLLDAEIEYWSAWQDWRDALVALSVATGATTPPSAGNDGAPEALDAKEPFES